MNVSSVEERPHTVKDHKGSAREKQREAARGRTKPASDRAPKLGKVEVDNE